MSPRQATVTKLLERLFGNEVANTMAEPFVLGNTKVLQSMFADAGISNAKIMTRKGTARFPSINSWVYTEIKGWTLADMIDDFQYQRLLQEAEKELQQFVTPEGTVAFRLSAHIVTATKV